MQYVENGVPEDANKLCFKGMQVPLCELSEEEYLWIVYGVSTKGKGKIGLGEPLEQQGKYYNEPIDILDLTIRAEHCLRRAGIDTVGQLCELTEAELAKLRNMGAKSLEDVKEKLATIGCWLRREEF